MISRVTRGLESALSTEDDDMKMTRLFTRRDSTHAHTRLRLGIE